MGGLGLRLVLEAGFLIALAVVAGFADLTPTTIVLVIGAGWLLVAVIEWLTWRESPRITSIAREEAAPALEAVPAPAPVPMPVEAPAADSEPARRRFWRRRPAEPEPEPERAGEDTQDLVSPPEQEPTPVSVDDRSGP